jgi:hypothetical protein
LCLALQCLPIVIPAYAGIHGLFAPLEPTV